MFDFEESKRVVKPTVAVSHARNGFVSLRPDSLSEQNREGLKGAEEPHPEYCPTITDG
jgi:hypothetical protein